MKPEVIRIQAHRFVGPHIMQTLFRMQISVFSFNANRLFHLVLSFLQADINKR
jgi:hypothetical protein